MLEIERVKASKVIFKMSFLGAFAKLRRVTNNLLHVCLSDVCFFVPMEQLGSHWTDFMKF
jgi:hypothetical protein